MPDGTSYNARDLAVLLGSILYRLVIQVALSVGLNPNDMKLISAVLVIAALLLPRSGALRLYRIRRRARQLEQLEKAQA